MPTAPDIAPAREATVARALVNRTEIPAAEAATREGKLKAKVLEAREKKRQEAVGSRGVLDAWHNESPVDIPDAAKAEDVIAKQVDKGKQEIALDADKVLRMIFTGDKVELVGKMGLTQASLVDSLRKVMYEIPEYKAIAEEIDATTNAAGNNIAGNEWVRFVVDQLDAGRKSGDNRFIDKLRENYTALINKDRGEVLSQSAVGRELAGLKNTHDVKNAEFSENESSITETQAKIASYKDTTAPDALGKKLIEQRAVVKDDVKVAQYKIQQGELANLEAQVTDRKDARSSTTNAIRHREIDGEIKALNEQIADKKAEMKPYEQEAQKLQDMEAEKAGLPTSLTQLYDRAKVLETEIDGIAERITAAEAALSNATGGKKEDLGAELQGLVGEAFKETMLARLGAERADILVEYDTLIKGETDENAKLILTQLRDNINRWNKWETKEHRSKILPWKKTSEDEKVFNEAQAQTDKNTLLKTDESLPAYQKGPEGLIYSMLVAKGVGDVEAQALVADKAFMDKVGPRAVEAFLKQAVRNDMLTEREIEIISDTEWGKEALDKALAANQEITEEIDKEMKEEGVKESRMEWLKKRKKAGLIALLLMGTVPAFGLLVPAAYLGYKVFKQ